MIADRRRARRFTAPEQRTGLLRKGWRQFPVVIDNESAGGFAVTVSRNYRCLDEGAELELVTSAGTYLVGVVYRTPLSRGIRLGLHRRDELREGRQSSHLTHFTVVAVLAFLAWFAVRHLLDNLGYL